VTQSKEIWETVLGIIQIEVNRANFNTWFKDTEGVRFENGRFTIRVPNTFVLEYLQKSQRSLIEKILSSFLKESISADFEVRPGLRSPVAPSIGLNPRYTFENFVVGSSNRLAQAATMKVIQDLGKVYNPLFIYGETGVGKTHLIQAAGNLAAKNNYQVLYTTGERFTNEFISSLKEGTADEFRYRYRNADVLLVDDIQFIAGKEQTQESFFHTFNELHDARGQIVLTSNQTPKEMSLIEEKLRSRLEWGLVVDIKPPDLETRMAILESKSKDAGLELIPEVIEMIARQAKRNIRELEGYLNRVIALARLMRSEATTELAEEALRDITNPPQNSLAQPKFIISTVAQNFGLDDEELTSKKRDKKIALAREVAIYLLKETGSYSLANIGEFFGNRSPSTISHAYQKIEQAIDDDAALKRRIEAIRSKL
jgi:chromosomal replication initiator protein